MSRDARLHGNRAPRPRAAAFDAPFQAPADGSSTNVITTSGRRPGAGETKVRGGGSQDPARCTTAAKPGRIARGPWPLDGPGTRGSSAGPWGLAYPGWRKTS